MECCNRKGVVVSTAVLYNSCMIGLTLLSRLLLSLSLQCKRDVYQRKHNDLKPWYRADAAREIGVVIKRYIILSDVFPVQPSRYRCTNMALTIQVVSLVAPEAHLNGVSLFCPHRSTSRHPKKPSCCIY